MARKLVPSLSNDNLLQTVRGLTQYITALKARSYGIADTSIQNRTIKFLLDKVNKAFGQPRSHSGQHGSISITTMQSAAPNNGEVAQQESREDLMDFFDFEEYDTSISLHDVSLQSLLSCHTAPPDISQDPSTSNNTQFESRSDQLLSGTHPSVRTVSESHAHPSPLFARVSDRSELDMNQVAVSSSDASFPSEADAASDSVKDRDPETKTKPLSGQRFVRDDFRHISILWIVDPSRYDKPDSWVQVQLSKRERHLLKDVSQVFKFDHKNTVLIDPSVLFAIILARELPISIEFFEGGFYKKVLEGDVEELDAWSEFICQAHCVVHEPGSYDGMRDELSHFQTTRGEKPRLWPTLDGKYDESSLRNDADHDEPQVAFIKAMLNTAWENWTGYRDLISRTKLRKN